MGENKLKKFFDENKKVALAFSGGVDSTYLLYYAKSLGIDVRPYFVKTVFQPDFELEDAMELAGSIGVDLSILYPDIMAREEVVKNPANRCYFCKSEIFSTILSQARQDGYPLVIDGSNGSDNFDDRPGMKALVEMGVRSPLREADLSKDQIRDLSKRAGLKTWDKPAYSCLATRIESGERISEENLKRVEMAEGVLFDLGFSDFRVRIFRGAARIQVREGDFDLILKYRKSIIEGLKAYFDVILLDLEER